MSLQKTVQEVKKRVKKKMGDMWANMTKEPENKEIDDPRMRSGNQDLSAQTALYRVRKNKQLLEQAANGS